MEEKTLELSKLLIIETVSRERGQPLLVFFFEKFGLQVFFWGCCIPGKIIDVGTPHEAVQNPIQRGRMGDGHREAIEKEQTNCEMQKSRLHNMSYKPHSSSHPWREVIWVPLPTFFSANCLYLDAGNFWRNLLYT